MNYGQAQALKVLAAARMGLVVCEEDAALTMLKGLPVHAMVGARVEREACRVHEIMRTSQKRVRVANGHVADLQREYGLVR